jgi:hypothetical protein
MANYCTGRNTNGHGRRHHYSGYTGEEICEALARIQKDRFPIRYERLVTEIEKRRLEAEKVVPKDAVTAVRYRPEFKGEPKEYFRIWIVNLALTILTLRMCPSVEITQSTGSWSLDDACK